MSEEDLQEPDGDLSGKEPASSRERIMRGALRCVETGGFTGFSLDDVARESGLSRTSIYRHFPGGRGQLIEETATWEVGRFWARLASAVADLDSLEDRLVLGLMQGAGQIRASRIVSNLLDPEMDEIIDALRPAQPLVQAVMTDYLVELLEVEQSAGRLIEGVDVHEAADYLTRMIVSVMTSPAGVDLGDPDTTRALVRRQFTAGIVATDPGSPAAL
ncbi:MAG: TetR/AcrR family transcriptional regulator [Microthrixaceae bacterium]